MHQFQNLPLKQIKGKHFISNIYLAQLCWEGDFMAPGGLMSQQRAEPQGDKVGWSLHADRLHPRPLSLIQRHFISPRGIIKIINFWTNHNPIESRTSWLLLLLRVYSHTNLSLSFSRFLQSPSCGTPREPGLRHHCAVEDSDPCSSSRPWGTTSETPLHLHPTSLLIAPVVNLHP